MTARRAVGSHQRNSGTRGRTCPAAAYEILRVSSIEAATPVALVFATDAATLAAALNSPAGAILTRPALLVPGATPAVDPSDPRLLPVADPRYAFAAGRALSPLAGSSRM